MKSDAFAPPLEERQLRSRSHWLVAVAAGLLLTGPWALIHAQDFLTNGLVAYYPLDADAKDYSGYGNDGTFVNVSAAPDRFGTPGAAVGVHGGGNYVEIPNSPQLSALESENEITISFWGCIPAGGAIGMNKYNPMSDGGWEIGYNDYGGGNIGWLTDQNPWPNYRPDTSYGCVTAIPAEWIHLVATASRSSQTVSFYKSGQPLKTICDAFNMEGQPFECEKATNFHLGASGGPLYLGYSPLGPDEFYVGQLDDLRIYSRALSETEVRTLYEYESNQNLPSSPPVIRTQPMGESLYVGDTARLDVRAAGTWPLAYQWRKNRTELLNATNATLVLPHVTLADAGDYTVDVANDFGSVTSAVVRLTVTARLWPYFADFEGAVGQEWSKRQTEVTPAGNRRFLGQCGNDTVSLTLNSLPPHQAVTVSFDLFLIRTWDGLQPGSTEVWDLSISGGPTLLHTTFLNFPFDWPVSQSFPDEYPGGNHPARTGAAENNTLGFIWLDSGVMDAVYPLVFTFPHAAGAVTLNFSGIDLEDIWNESWGLDNVRIELTPPSGTAYVCTALSAQGNLTPPAQGPAELVALSGAHALVSVGETAVGLVDLSNPAMPVWLGSWEPLFPPSDLALAGNLAFIASYEPDFLSTIEVVDFSDPAQPVLRGYYDTDGYARDLVVAGTTLYVADDLAGLVIVDISDPARPRPVGGYETQGRVTQVEVAGGRAHLADGDWLLILDVSDPTWPRRVGVYDVGGAVQELRIVGQAGYVLVGGELRLLDVTDPGDIRSLGSYSTFGVRSLTVVGRYACLAKGSRGLEIVDVGDPAKPVWITGLTTAGPALDAAMEEQNVIVASGEKGLAAYRVAQSLYPPLAPPVITDGFMTLSWPAMEGVRLQRATHLIPAQWEGVTGSEGTNMVRLPVTETTGFFRLVK